MTDKEQYKWLDDGGFIKVPCGHTLTYSKQLMIDDPELEMARELHFTLDYETNVWEISLYAEIHFASIPIVCNIPFDEDFTKFQPLIDLIV